MSDLVVREEISAPLDRARVAGDWRRRRFSYDLFVDPSSREWNDFVHATNELVTVADGKLELTIAGQCHEAAPGDEFLIPNNARHSSKSIHSGTKRWLYGYD